MLLSLILSSLLGMSRSCFAQGTVSPDMLVRASGVAAFPFENEPKNREGYLKTVPRLQIVSEDVLNAPQWDSTKFAIPEVKRPPATVLETPPFWSNKEFEVALGTPVESAGSMTVVKSIYDNEGFGIVSLQKVAEVGFQPELDQVVTPQSIKSLSNEDLKFLRARLLFERKNCLAASGMFFKLATEKRKDLSLASKFYLGSCLSKLKLHSQAIEYLFDVLKSDRHDLHSEVVNLLLHFPMEFDTIIGHRFSEIVRAFTFGDIEAHVFFLIAKSALKTGDYNMALKFAQDISEKSEYFYRAQFILATALDATERKTESLVLFKRLWEKMPNDDIHQNLRSSIALYLERAELQKKNYTEAHSYFMSLPKDHAFGISGLLDYGWSQILSGDIKGSLDSMSLLQNKYRNEYKPETYILRSIAFMKLCQYTAAERELSEMESEYQSYHDIIKEFRRRYNVSEKIYLHFAKNEKSLVSHDLPPLVHFELAREMGFLNLQGSITTYSSEISRLSEILQSLTNETNLHKNFASDRRPASQIEGQQFDNFEFQSSSEAETDFRLFKEKASRTLENLLHSVVRQAGDVLKTHLEKLDHDLDKMFDNADFIKYEIYEKQAVMMRAGVNTHPSGSESANVCVFEEKEGFP